MVEWDRLGINQADQQKVESRYQRLLRDPSISRSLHILSDDHPQIRDFVTQALATMDSEKDFFDLQELLKDTKITSATKDQSCEWLEAFTSTIDMGKFQARMSQGFQDFRTYSV